MTRQQMLDLVHREDEEVQRIRDEWETKRKIDEFVQHAEELRAKVNALQYYLIS